MLATLAAFESTRLLILFVLLICWFIYKRLPFILTVAIVFIGFFTFFYVDHVNPEKVEHNEVKTITWTDNYRINGRFIRGFATSETNQKWYVQLKITDEQHKDYFSNNSLTGMELQVKADKPIERPMSHKYAFDIEQYIKSNGAIGQILIEEYSILTKDTGFRIYMAEQRFKLKQHIQQTFPKTLQAEAEALLIGSRESMPRDLQDAYLTLGITHLFAISGLHVTLVVMLLYEVMVRIGVRRETANWILILALPLYGFIAGGAPSVWRAVSVTEILLVSSLTKNRLNISDAFSLSFILFLLYTPWVVYQTGFQLSYLAAFSLIYSSSLLRLSGNPLVQSFLITAICQLMVYPLLIYQFYEISLSSFLANLVFVPLFSFVILPINLFLLPLTFLSPIICNIFFRIYEPLRIWLDDFIIFLGALPFQMWNPGQPKLWYVVLAYISIFSFFILIENKPKVLLALCILLFPMLILQIVPYYDSNTRITYLNVGQGDSILIEMPLREKVILIDTGGLLRFDQEGWMENDNVYEIGRQVVVPFLKGRGISKIDVMILSHADADHMEGAEEILQAIRVGEVHITPGSYNESVMQDLREEINKQRISVLEKGEGEVIESSFYQLTYLYPSDSNYEGNDDSLVLSMENDYFKGLFIGDLESRGEYMLATHYSEQIKGQTILKLGHHGSKTSSTQIFLEMAHPRYAIVSAGLNNRYGHPHPEVVERLRLMGIPYFQTGKDGSIEVIITKKGEVTILPH